MFDASTAATKALNWSKEMPSRTSASHLSQIGAKTGTVDVIIDTATVDFAHDKLNQHVSGPEILDVAKYPTAEYKGNFVEFANGVPRSISANLTLHGVTKHVTLTINSFECIEHPMLKKQVCGADASVQLGPLTDGPPERDAS